MSPKIHKYNHHKRKLLSKNRDMMKNPPSFLYNKKIKLNKNQKRLKYKLDREYHWYSGMVKVANGRQQLKHDLKLVKNAYNLVLTKDDTPEKITLTNNELIKIYECQCEDCQHNINGPITDSSYETHYEAIEALEIAETIDANLKNNYEKWEYKY